MEKVVLLHLLGWQPGIQLNTNQANLKAFCSNIWLVWEVWLINGTRCKKKSYKKVGTVLRQMLLLLFLMFPPHCEKCSHAYWWAIFFFSLWIDACFKALQWHRSTQSAHAATSYLTQAVFFLQVIKTQFPVLFVSSPGFRVFLNICRAGH